MTLAELVYGHLDTRDRAKENELWAKCPFCNDSQFRLGINLLSGKAHCFCGSCDFRTSSKQYLFDSLCRQFHITGERLEDPYEVDEEQPRDKKKLAKVEVRLPSDFEPLWRGVNDSIGKKAKEYILSRGITETQILKHKIGFCAVGKYAYRIVFPVLKAKKLVGLVTRDFSGIAKYRYLNSEGTKTLYGAPRHPKEKAIVLEGVTDALAVERAVGFADALGRLGSSLTEAQQKILLRYKEIIVWPDPDQQGVKGCIEVCQWSLFQNIKTSVVMPTANDADPGKLGETSKGLKEIKNRIICRVPWDPSATPSLLRLRVLFEE